MILKQLSATGVIAAFVVMVMPPHTPGTDVLGFLGFVMMVAIALKVWRLA